MEVIDATRLLHEMQERDDTILTYKDMLKRISCTIRIFVDKWNKQGKQQEYLTIRCRISLFLCLSHTHYFYALCAFNTYLPPYLISIKLGRRQGRVVDLQVTTF